MIGELMVHERRIPGHEEYTIHTNGDVFGKTGRLLKGHVNRNGYREVLLTENGSSKMYLVHRLVLSTFYPRKNMEKYDVNHRNGNKLDNRLDNLEWCTRSDNIKHSYGTKLQTTVGNKHGLHRVLSEDDLQVIRDLHHQSYRDCEIAKELGCSRSLVSRKIRKLGIRNDHD